MESMKQFIGYLSSHIAQQDVRQDKLESRVKAQGEIIDKLACDSEMHFNIILGFTQGAQSQIGHSIGSNFKDNG